MGPALLGVVASKRRECNFLTVEHTIHGVAYKWGYPRKLLIDYHGKVIVIKTTSQARQFE